MKIDITNTDDSKNLLTYIQSSTSPYHTVQTSKEILLADGFTEIRLDEEWQLREGDYLVDIYGTTLFAFHIGANMRKQLHIATGHTDFPAFRIKPNPFIAQNGYGKINIEAYGGSIINTWLDRPLSVAGAVACKGDSPYEPDVTLVDIKRPIATIPNLAIHMNRQMNEGVALNKQTQMLPLLTSLDGSDDKENEWSNFLSKEVGCAEEDILSFELTLYPTEEGTLLGLHDEFISSPRLDNLTSCYACLVGLVEAKRNNVEGLSFIALFDNEEVGSRTKQGGASTVLTQVITRIYSALGYSSDECYADISKGFMISSDVAHALHPNYVEKNDLTNKPVLNGGVVLKVASSQAYAGDVRAIATVKALCKSANIAYQVYVNRSDIPGGSTLGSIASSVLPMRTMDIGVAILGMHSIREVMGRKDQIALNQLMKVFLGN